MGIERIVIVVLAFLGMVLVGLSLWRNPVLRRISLRNVGRRKGSTLLVIAGSMVGTALIAGSLVISDTSAEVMDLLVHLNQERGQTFVIVIHDPGVSSRAHRVIQMKDGRILDYVRQE